MKKTVKKTLRKSVAIPRGASPTSDKMALFLGLLMSLTATRKEYQEKGDFISIHSKRIQKCLGRNYYAVIREAMSLGLVEENPRYSTGGKFSEQGSFTKSYRLTSAFRSGSWEEYTLKRARIDHSRIELKHADKVGKALAKSLERVQLPETDSSMTAWDEFLLGQIKTGAIYVKRCGYGRLHTSYTGLSKGTRLRLKTESGEGMIEIDISSCQPLLLFVVITREMDKCERDGFEPAYRRLCESGELYNHILREYQRPGGKPGMTVEKVKKQFIRLLFQENHRMCNNKLFSVVGQQFPSLILKVMEMKTSCYKNLSHLLQKLEAEIMIDGVCGNILNSHPAATLVTVHDSILCAEEMQDDVVNVIHENFRVHGVKPHVKTHHIDHPDSMTLKSSSGQEQEEASPTHGHMCCM